MAPLFVQESFHFFVMEELWNSFTRIEQLDICLMSSSLNWHKKLWLFPWIPTLMSCSNFHYICSSNPCALDAHQNEPKMSLIFHIWVKKDKLELDVLYCLCKFSICTKLIRSCKMLKWMSVQFVPSFLIFITSVRWILVLLMPIKMNPKCLLSFTYEWKLN